MMRGKVCNAQSCYSITKATLEDETANEGRRTSGGYADSGCVVAFVKHLLSSQRGIALADHSVMIGRVASRVMQDVAFESHNPGLFVHHDRFMNATFAPVTASSVVKA